MSISGKKTLIIVCLAAIIVLTTVFATLPFVAGATSITKEEAEVIVGKSLTDDEFSAIRDGFATAATELQLQGGEDIQALREILIYQRFDDAAIVYNYATGGYFAVRGSFCTKYFDSESFRQLGAPAGNRGSFVIDGATVSGTVEKKTYDAQIFEKGVLIDDGSVTMLIAAPVENADGSVTLLPLLKDQDIMSKVGNGYSYIGDIDGQMHPLKFVDVEISTVNGETQYDLYANFSSCAAHITYDAEFALTNKLVYPLKNYFVSNGERVLKILPSCCYLITDILQDGNGFIDSNALSYYKTYVTDGTEESLYQLFEDKYLEMLSDGFVGGYRCSHIKMWTWLVLDLRFGDGTTGFDSTGTGDRERMTCLVYNPDKNAVYPVYNTFFILWKEDSGIGRNSLGYPASDVMKNKTIGGKTYEEIQLYKNGYIALVDGNYQAFLGYEYDETNNEFVPVPSPSVPDRYGNEIGRKTVGSTVYINYERGAIECKLTVNKTQYKYTCYGGRNFDFENGCEAKLLSMDKLLTYDQLTYVGAVPVEFSKIKLKLYTKYQQLYEQGFVCGFVEEQFKGSWNNVYAQQFIEGDSTSMIFGEERPYVCALVYSRNNDEVYLLKDDVIKIWQANYSIAGSPTSDEYQLEGYDYWFQTFDFGMTIRLGNYIVFTEDYESPEDYIDYVESLDVEVPTHNNKQGDGYVG